MPKTLLLADDSVTIQKVVGISFANEDVVLLTVDNGDDAVIRAREARPDLVLADVMMPGKDGYEVCETLKADPELRHVPVLLLSGTFEPFDEERARRAGADGHITKPFEAQALVDQVNALLARASAPAPAEPLAAPAGDATIAVGSDPADAFDFFDEELAQTAPSPSVAAATRLDDEGDPLELETAVEDDEPVPATPLPGDLAAAGDSQATVLFEDEPPALTRRSATPPPLFGDDFDSEALAAPTPIAGHGVASAASPAGYEESFDFGFEDGGASATALSPVPAPIPTSPPAQEAMTQLFDDEPEADESPLPALAPTPQMPPMPEPLVATSTPPSMPPMPEATSMPEPAIAMPTPPWMPAMPEPLAATPTPPSMATTPEPMAATSTPPSSMPWMPEPLTTPAPAPMPWMSEPVAMPAPPPMPEPPVAMPTPPPIPTPPPVPQAAPPPVASTPEAPLAVPVAGPVALSEPIQKQLQETLEKIVWEAFGDLSERIVRDVIERVESVAWEVIPQMAETLIREEIRKLKGEDA